MHFVRSTEMLTAVHVMWGVADGPAIAIGGGIGWGRLRGVRVEGQWTRPRPRKCRLLGVGTDENAIS